MTEFTNTWIEEGKQQGLQEGRQEGQHAGALRTVLRVLGRRVGLPGPAAQAQLAALPAEALEDLAEAAVDFEGPEALLRWLEGR